MKSAERDQLLTAQVAAAESLAVELAGVRAQLAVFGRERRERVLPPLKRLPRRRLDGLPGWDFVVPAESVSGGVDPVVTCRCEAETTLTMKLPMECAGGCGRWFLRTMSDVRVEHETRMVLPGWPRFNEDGVST